MPQRKRISRNLAGAGLVLCLAALYVGARAQSASRAPLSKEDVLRLLKGDVSPKRVADLAHQRNIDFDVTLEVEKELREAGADDSLLTALREVAPKAVAPASTAPAPALATLLIDGTPGAHVYLNDAPAGTTSPEGKLKLPNLQPGEHKVRLSLDGYKDEEANVSLTSGEAPVWLRLEPRALSERKAEAAEREHGGGRSPSEVQSLQLWHIAGVIAHSGIFSTAPGRVSWTEKGHPSDNFSAQCWDIGKVLPYGLRLQFGSKQRNYTFSPEPKLVKKDLGGLAELHEAISAACPRGFGPYAP